MTRRVLIGFLALLSYLRVSSSRDGASRASSTSLSTAATSTTGSRSSCPGPCAATAPSTSSSSTAPSSPNLLFFFEGGGACWDYDTCSGRAGMLGAANPNGIADDYMAAVHGQVRVADRERRRPGPAAAQPDRPADQGLEHRLHAVLHRRRAHRQPRRRPTWIRPAPSRRSRGTTPASTTRPRRPTTRPAQFPSVNKLLVTGFSAGGTATSAAYYFVRTAHRSAARLPAQRLRPGLPGAERRLQLARAARPDPRVVGPGLGVQPAARPASTRTTSAASTGWWRRPSRTTRSPTRRTRATTTTRASPTSGSTIRTTRRRCSRSGTRTRTTWSTMLRHAPQRQLLHPARPADQRQPLLDHHHLHRQPRLPADGEEAPLVGVPRVAARAVVQVLQRVRADGDVPPAASSTRTRAPASTSRPTGTTTRIRGCSIVAPLINGALGG